MISCRICAAMTLWLPWVSGPGPPRSHEALTLAHELAHPFSLAYALILGDHGSISGAERTCRPARQAEALSRSRATQGFPFLLAALGTMLAMGGRWPMQGQREEGMAQIRQGMAAYRATGAGGGPPVFSGPAGRGVWPQVGNREKRGLRCWPRPSLWWTTGGIRYWEAEIYRLKGRVTACGSPRKHQLRRKPAFIRPSPLPATSKPSHWSYGLL